MEVDAQELRDAIADFKLHTGVILKVKKSKQLPKVFQKIMLTLI